MPQWTPHRSVPGSFGVRAGGAGVLLIRGDNGQELHVFHVDHAVDTDAQRSQAWWCRRRGIPLDAAGNVRGWSAVETHLTGQLLPTGYMAIAPGFLRDAVYPKFSFVGGCATRAGGKVLLFDRFRHLSRPDETSEQIRAVGEQRDLPVALRSAESAAASWGPGRIDVVAIGADGAMWHKTWDNNRWMPSPDGWSSLGGVFTSGPAIVTLGPGSLHLFGLGGDAGMYHREWDGSAWSSWRPLGGVFMAAPVAIGRAGRVDVFGLGTDGAMYQRWWTAAAGWQPSAWVSLGGIFALK